MGRQGPTSHTLTRAGGEMGTSLASPADKCFGASSTAAQLLPGRDPWQLLVMGTRCPGKLKISGIPIRALLDAFAAVRASFHCDWRGIRPPSDPTQLSGLLKEVGERGYNSRPFLLYVLPAPSLLSSRVFPLAPARSGRAGRGVGTLGPDPDTGAWAKARSLPLCFLRFFPISLDPERGTATQSLSS